MLHGRDAELARIAALLDAARAGRSGVLVVRGEPGVGKTALLDAACEAAPPDTTVLRARGVESESELPFAGLHRLLWPLVDRVERLPPPQAGALRAALGIASAHAADPFLVFAGCLTLTADLAEDGPVLAVIDDAHWLDAASTDALLFVARRLDAEGVVVLLGAREGDPRRLTADDLPSLTLAGLAPDAAATLLDRHTDLATAVRDRLLEQTHGNPLALLELPGALNEAQRQGREPLPEALPVTGEIERVFLARVRRLPDATQRLLVLAAIDDTEDLGTLARAAAALGLDLRDLDPAQAAGLVETERRRIGFRHPLVRSALYGAAPLGERLAAHRALATALEDVADAADRRAWHLAAATVEPDEQAVAALVQAAERAHDRGGYPAAARALARAAELSADPGDRGRRLVAAARAASLAGWTRHAGGLAEQAASLVDDPLLVAEIARVRAIAEVTSGRARDGQRRLVEAADAVAEIGPEKALELYAEATHAAREVADLTLMAEIGRGVEAIAPQLGEADRPVARLLTAYKLIGQGDTRAAAPLIDEGVVWAREHDDPRHVILASAAVTWLGDFPTAAELVGHAAGLARAGGAMALLAGALGLHAPMLNLAQRFNEAEIAAAEAVALSRDLGLPNQIPLPLAVLTHVAAIRGDAETARRHADEVLERAAIAGLATPPGVVVQALALLDLAGGRWDEAADRFGSVSRARVGVSSLIVAVMSAADRVEAAVRAGRRDEADEALALFTAWSAGSGARWAPPLLAACRGLVADAPDEAERHYAEAIALEAQARPFDRARIRLLYGEHLRRARRRLDARVHLRAAIDGFDRLDAEPWSARARGELRASGETARRRDAGTRGDLTPQERQVAQLVADGLTNKEVAAQLFLSPRTVDAHLRSVFAKLGVSSRTQLARRLPAAAEPAPAPA